MFWTATWTRSDVVRTDTIGLLLIFPLSIKWRKGPNIVSSATAWRTLLAPIRLLKDADQVANITPMRTNHFQKVKCTMYIQSWIHNITMESTIHNITMESTIHNIIMESKIHEITMESKIHRESTIHKITMESTKHKITMESTIH